MNVHCKTNAIIEREMNRKNEKQYETRKRGFINDEERLFGKLLDSKIEKEIKTRQKLDET